MLVSELNGFNNTDHFVDITSNGQIVVNNDTYDTLRVDDDVSTKRMAFFLKKNTVVPGNLVGHIRKKGNLDGAETSLLARDVGPGEESVRGVDRAHDQLGTQLPELFSAFRESNDFGGAHKGVCEGEEDQDDELSFIVAEANFLDLSVNDGHSGELGGFLANLADHSNDFNGLKVVYDCRESEKEMRESARKEVIGESDVNNMHLHHSRLQVSHYSHTASAALPHCVSP